MTVDMWLNDGKRDGGRYYGHAQISPDGAAVVHEQPRRGASEEFRAQARLQLEMTASAVYDCAERQVEETAEIARLLYDAEGTHVERRTPMEAEGIRQRADRRLTELDADVNSRFASKVESMRQEGALPTVQPARRPGQ